MLDERTNAMIAPAEVSSMQLIDDKPWFGPKRVGYGTGLPVTCQGWAVLAIFVVGIAASSDFLAGWERVAAISGLIIALGLI